MDVPNFDVDSLRHQHESNAEWKLRRAFLLQHRDKFPIKRLLCLASCFINFECYGCRYPGPVMQQIKLLTEELPEEVAAHREKMKELTQVKFVKAAGEDEGGPSPPKMARGGTGKKMLPMVHGNTNVGSQKVKPMSFVKSNETYRSFNADELPDTSLKTSCESSILQDKFILNIEKKFHVLKDRLKKMNFHQAGHNMSLGDFHNQASKAGLQVSFEFSQNGMHGPFSCVVQLDDVKIGEGQASSKKEAKKDAVECTVKRMSKFFFKVIEVAGGKLELEVSDSQFPGHSSHLTTRHVPSPVNRTKAQLKNTRKAPVLHYPESTGNVTPYSDNVKAKNLNNFLLFEPVEKSPSHTSVSILHQSASFNRYVLTYDYRDEVNPSSIITNECSVYLEGFPLARATGESKISAKKQAADTVLQQLREVCWTIQTKKPEEGGMTIKELMKDNLEVGVADAIPESNIGSRMLKKMGWTGGGIGKDGKGIAEPVCAAGVVNRSGIGLASEQGITPDFLSRIQDVITNYLMSDEENNLVFASDFSKEQRALIHKECQKLGLKTNSYGKGEERHLVASRKRTPHQLLEYLQQSGGETPKYILVAPGEHPDLKK